jgi:hypothetical protein
VKPLAAALIVIAGAPARVAAPAPPTVSVAWREATPLPADVRAGAEAEVDALFARAGLAVSWTAPDETPPPDALPLVVVEKGRSPTLPPRLLGASSPDRAAGVWIFYSAIRSEVGLHGADRPLSARETKLLGRALGRVIAHEVVHAYQTTHAHAADGLMGRHLDAGQLTSAAIEWDMASQAAFVRALHRELGAAGHGTARPLMNSWSGLE